MPRLPLSIDCLVRELAVRNQTEMIGTALLQIDMAHIVKAGLF